MLNEGAGGARLSNKSVLMLSQFAAQTISLGQLFAIILNTPSYQRPFAWEQREAGRLLDDLAVALESEGEGGELDEYFLGTMLFIEERPVSRLAALPFSRQLRVLEVVDGLQRLTTLTILFCVLRDLEEQAGIKANERLLAAIGTGQGAGVRHRLQVRAPDERFFQSCVRAPGATLTEAPAGKLSPAEKRIIEVRNHLVEAVLAFEPSQRQRLADFLLDKCHVVSVSTSGIDRAHRIFTVLNATGKPLARNDILKADLLGGVPPEAMSRVTAIWDRAEASLGGRFEEFFSHIRFMHGRGSDQVIAGIRSIAAEVGGGQAFIERVLQPTAQVFDAINEASHAGTVHSARITRSLTYLGWLPSADWVPPALLWWVERGSDASELAWFLERLDRLAYGLRILGHGGKRRLSRFNAVIHAIRQRRDLRGSSSPLTLTRDEVRTIQHNLRDLHARSAPICKLVLLRLNDAVTGRAQNLPLKDMTVEHILPRKPGVNSPWRTWFPDPADRDKFTESLGNLVLTTKRQNDKCSNLDFAHKQDVLFNTPDVPLPLLNDYVRRQSEWRVPQIIERETELLAQLYALWDLGPPPPPRTEEPAGSPARRRRQPQPAARA